MVGSRLMAKLVEKCPMIPLFNHVLVQPSPNATTTASGLHIPATAENAAKSLSGKVVAVGPGKMSAKGHFIPTTVRIGQTVHFGKHPWPELEVNGEKHFVMPEDQIFAVEE